MVVSVSSFVLWTRDALLPMYICIRRRMLLSVRLSVRHTVRTARLSITAHSSSAAVFCSAGAALFQIVTYHSQTDLYSPVGTKYARIDRFLYQFVVYNLDQHIQDLTASLSAKDCLYSVQLGVCMQKWSRTSSSFRRWFIHFHNYRSSYQTGTEGRWGASASPTAW